MIRSLLLSLFALTVLLWTPPLAAEDDKNEARRHFESGVQLLQDSRFAEAAEVLERSLAIRESPPVLYNLGLAYRGTGQYQTAIGHLERFLEVGGAERYADMRKSVEQVLGELRGSLVRVTVVAQGGARRVEVDGRPIAKRDGRHEVVLDPGTYKFQATRPGHAGTAVEVKLGPGEKKVIELDAAATPEPARLIIDAKASNAEIRLDGKFVGRGTHTATVKPGKHKIRLSASGYEPETRTVDLAPGDRQRVSISLTKKSGGIASKWWFWTGAAAVVVGGAVTAAFLAQPDKEPLHEGSLGFVVEALR